jgi:hypothetical protein
MELRREQVETTDSEVATKAFAWWLAGQMLAA